MIKVLQIIDHYGLGGAQSLVQNIIQNRHNTYLIPLRSKRSNQIKLPEDRCLLPPSNSVIHFLLKMFQTPLLILQNKINIVHCHLIASWMFGLWLRICLWKNQDIQFVFHEHDSARIGSWYYPLLLQMIQRVGKIIVVSEHTRRDIIARGANNNNVHLLNNFVDLKRFSPSSNPDSKLLLDPTWAEDYHLVGFAGRLIREKGWQHILHIAHRLREKKVKFLIAGAGRDEKKLRRMIASQGLRDQICCLGHLHNMPAFYHTVEILIFPSSQESFGLVQIEAQACGVPVVAFAIEASREFAGVNSAILVTPQDTEGLVTAITQILNDPELRTTLIQNGLKHARLFSMKDYLEKLDAFYFSLLNSIEICPEN